MHQIKSDVVQLKTQHPDDVPTEAVRVYARDLCEAGGMAGLFFEDITALIKQQIEQRYSFNEAELWWLVIDASEFEYWHNDKASPPTRIDGNVFIPDLVGGTNIDFIAFLDFARSTSHTPNDGPVLVYEILYP